MAERERGHRRLKAAAARRRAPAGARPWVEEKAGREEGRRKQLRHRRARTAGAAGRQRSREHRRAGRPSHLQVATERGEREGQALGSRRTQAQRMQSPSPVPRRDDKMARSKEGRHALGPRVGRQQQGGVGSSRDPVEGSPDDAAEALAGETKSAESQHRHHAPRAAPWERAAAPTAPAALPAPRQVRDSP